MSKHASDSKQRHSKKYLALHARLEREVRASRDTPLHKLLAAVRAAGPRVAHVLSHLQRPPPQPSA